MSDDFHTEKLCPGSGTTYIRLSSPIAIMCPRCMTRLTPTGRRIEWTLPDHTREGRLVVADPEVSP